jgi:hypothetical protein
LEQLVQTLVSILKDDFIVIDAVDECKEEADERERTLFFDALRELNASVPEKLKVFITSRLEPDIRIALSDLDAITLNTEQEKVDQDIRAHIRGCLIKDKRLSKWSQKVREEIEANLMEKANGM